MEVRIEVRPNHVIVEGHGIDRPDRVSPKQWLEFWESNKTNAEEIEELKEENLKLENTIFAKDEEISRLQSQLDEAEERLNAVKPNVTD